MHHPLLTIPVTPSSHHPCINLISSSMHHPLLTIPASPSSLLGEQITVPYWNVGSRIALKCRHAYNKRVVSESCTDRTTLCEDAHTSLGSIPTPPQLATCNHAIGSQYLWPRLPPQHGSSGKYQVHLRTHRRLLNHILSQTSLSLCTPCARVSLVVSFLCW